MISIATIGAAAKLGQLTTARGGYLHPGPAQRCKMSLLALPRRWTWGDEGRPKSTARRADTINLNSKLLCCSCFALQTTILRQLFVADSLCGVAMVSTVDGLSITIRVRTLDNICIGLTCVLTATIDLTRRSKGWTWIKCDRSPTEDGERSRLTRKRWSRVGRFGYRHGITRSKLTGF